MLDLKTKRCTNFQYISGYIVWKMAYCFLLIIIPQQSTLELNMEVMCKPGLHAVDGYRYHAISIGFAKV